MSYGKYLCDAKMTIVVCFFQLENGKQGLTKIFPFANSLSNCVESFTNDVLLSVHCYLLFNFDSTCPDLFIQRIEIYVTTAPNPNGKNDSLWYVYIYKVRSLECSWKTN